MANYNKVLLMGNLTRDPEVRYLPSNMAVAKIGLAVNRKWRNQQTNEMQEETTFVDCEAWGKTAETMGKFLSKGKPVFIEGRLKLDQWQDKEGQNRSRLLVVIETFQFIDSKGGEGGSGGGGNYGGGESRGSGASGGYSRSGASSSAPAARGPASGSGGGPPEPSDDDIPF